MKNSITIFKSLCSEKTIAALKSIQFFYISISETTNITVIFEVMNSPPTLEKVKIVLIGNSAVGKTALFQRMKTDTYNENSTPTVGGACANIDVDFNSQTVPLILWDTAGQDSFREIVPMYFNRASFIIIVYDITNKKSFEDVAEWTELSKNNASESVHLILLGNKVDQSEKRQVALIEGQEQADKMNALTFLEVSAKEGILIDDLLSTIADQVLKDFLAQPNKLETNEIDLTSSATKKTSSCC